MNLEIINKNLRLDIYGFSGDVLKIDLSALKASKYIYK
jgi:hypothetical protein